MSDVIKMQPGYATTAGRRPATSYPFRQAFSPSPRIHSAHPRINITKMLPRTQVSVANFYDWSEDHGDGATMTNIYRKIASIPKSRMNKPSKNWCAGGIHLNPGRMFLRDKADLTKGEREIIAGIYKNRGDLSNRETKRELERARSHRDAWLLGRQIAKREDNIEKDELSLKVPEHLFSSRVEKSKSPRAAPCYMCMKCKDECVNHKRENGSGKPEADIPGRIAPPTTPDMSPKTMRKNTKVPPIKTGEGGILIEAEKTFYDEDGANRKRVFVDVFLPKIPAQLADDRTFVSTIDAFEKRKSNQQERPKPPVKASGLNNIDPAFENPKGSKTKKGHRRIPSRDDSCSGE